MADESKAVSPTGEPIVSQRVLRIAMVVYVALGGLAAGLYAAGIGGRVTTVVGLALATLAPVLGLASPGLRKPPTPSAD